jgi:hypothetical protein
MSEKKLELTISENMLPVIKFIDEIDKEVSDLFYFYDNQNVLIDAYKQLLSFSKFACREFEARRISLDSYSFDLIKPATEALVQQEQPVRCQMIAVFAYLETLFALYLAYTKCIFSLGSIKNEASNDNNKKKFINSYLLTSDNIYYKQHRKFVRLDSAKVIHLRNILTHFFSVTDKHIIINSENTKSIENKLYAVLKEQKMGDIVNLSPRELQSLVKEAGIVMITKWSEESKNNNVEFSRKISFVQKIVHEYGAVIVSQKEMAEMLKTSS